VTHFSLLLSGILSKRILHQVMGSSRGWLPRIQEVVAITFTSCVMWHLVVWHLVPHASNRCWLWYHL